jgi:hypothetical protein
MNEEVKGRGLTASRSVSSNAIRGSIGRESEKRLELGTSERLGV